MKILAVDSSSITASVALVECEKTIAEFHINAGLTHSETLAPMIKSVLSYSKIDIKEIDLFAVTTGPGSFTGLRIGLATVKAMALGCDKPYIGVSSLYALSKNYIQKNSVICACIDARRGGVYNALFKVDNEKIIRLTQDRAICVENLISELRNYNNPIQFVGDGAMICYNSMTIDYTTDNIILVSENNRYIKASNVAIIAKEIYNNNENYDECMESINYIRVPQAERLLKENKLNLQVKN